jgi:hypothetical protein
MASAKYIVPPLGEAGASASGTTTQPEGTYWYLFGRVPRSHFDERAGGYWRTLALLLATGPGAAAAAVALVGRYNGWPVLYIVPSALMLACAIAISLKTPCVPACTRPTRMKARIHCILQLHCCCTVLRFDNAIGCSSMAPACILMQLHRSKHATQAD